jgi:uncharacterized protein
MKWLSTVSLLFMMSVAWVQQTSQVPIAELLKKAEAGDVNAQMEVAEAYEKGKGVAQSDALAAQWYRKAAEQGNAKAQNTLGVMYRLGLGVPRDKQEAFRWYQKAAKQNLPEADYNIAVSYYNGDGVPSDVVLAYTWMMLAQRNGDKQAEQALIRMESDFTGNFQDSRMKLASMYEEGKEIPADLPAAVAIYREAAAKNSQYASSYRGKAQYRLCQFYAAGKGMPQDYTQAKSWCREAAANSINETYLVLGRMAERGLGGPKDPKEAMIWYHDAALSGFNDGFIQLAKLKAQGSHSEQKEAYFWLYLAQRLQIKEADAPLQQLTAQLSSDEVRSEQKKVIKWQKEKPLEYRTDEIKFPK